jgi:hypothetical protein
MTITRDVAPVAGPEAASLRWRVRASTSTSAIHASSWILALFLQLHHGSMLILRPAC